MFLCFYTQRNEKLMTVYNIKRFLLDILYPNQCPFCAQVIAYDQYYCCLGDLVVLEDDYALFEYNETTSQFVYSVKEQGDGYAICAAAKLMCEKFIGDDTGETGVRSSDIDLITCIPTDSFRMKQRGYNPPALIAREMSAITAIPHDPKLLTKTRRTDVQKSLCAIERQENLIGAFALNKNKVCPQNILVIDDVRTTGATLGEAARVLLAAGAKNVYTFVIAAVI
jgi:ComF family protein